MKVTSIRSFFMDSKLKAAVTRSKNDVETSEKKFVKNLLKLSSSKQELYLIRYAEAIGAKLDSTQESTARRLLKNLLTSCKHKSKSLFKRIDIVVKNILLAHKHKTVLLHQTASTLLSKSDFHKFPGEDVPLSELNRLAKDKNRMLELNMQITKQLYNNPHPKIKKLLDIEKEQKQKFFIKKSEKKILHEFQYEAMHMAEFPKGNKMVLLRQPAPATIGAYFTMAFREKAPVAVTLCSPVEGRRIIPFWDENEAKKYLPDGWTIKNTKTTVLGEVSFKNQPRARIVERKLKISHGGKSHTLTHIHYENWPDHGQADPTLLRQMLERCDKISRAQKGPIIVNCRGGVGRTATFAMFNICRRVLRGLVERGIDLKKARINIPEIIYSVRMQRPRVQSNPLQMSLLYKMVGDYYNELIYTS